MMSEDVNNEARRLAWVGTIQTAFISLGAAILAVGISLVFGMIQLLFQMIDKEEMTEQNARLIEFLNTNAVYLMLFGLIIVGLGVLYGYLGTHRKAKQPKSN